MTESPELICRQIDQQDRAILRLWSAVMIDGVRAASAGFYDEAKTDKPNQDMRWFLSDEKYPGSWTWLCDLFDFDPDMARRRARSKFRAMEQERRANAKKWKKEQESSTEEEQK